MRLLLLLLSLCSFSVFAQQKENKPITFQITGIVLDSVDSRPLIKAAVLVDFRKIGVNTDDDGKFSLTLVPGDYWLSIRLLGYRPTRVKVRLREDVSLNLRLNSLANELEEVIVSSKGADANIQRPLLGVNQLSIKTLQRIPAAFGEVDILRGLQMLPGVTSVGEAANGVNVRGGTTDQNLFLLDDAPIFNPTHMFGLFSAFPPDAVSSVELYKGNAPARFGGRAAAVMDVTLASPNLEKFKLSGGISLVSNRLQADIPLIKNKMGLIITGRGAFNDFLLPIASERLDNIKAKFGDAAAKFFYRINDRNTVSLSSYWTKDFFQTELLGTLNNIAASATQFDHRSLNFTGRWFHAFSSKLNLQTSVISADYVPKIVLPEKGSDNKVVIRSGIRQLQGKINLNYIRENQKLEFGGTAIRYNINPGELQPNASKAVGGIKTPLEQGLEMALHGDVEQTFSKRLTLSAGLRYSVFLSQGPGLMREYAPNELRDDFTVIDSTQFAKGATMQTYGGFEPRFGMKYSLGNTSSIKAGYSLMRQYLQVVSNTTTPLPTARWKTSDMHVRPQVSHLISAGYFKNFRDDVFELSVEAYYRLTDGVLDYKPGADFLLQRFPETQLLQGINRSWGVETMLSKKRGETTGWVSYTYSRSQNRINEGPAFLQQVNRGNWYSANYDRPHNINAALNINQGKHNNISLNFTYSTGRPYTAPSGMVQYQGRFFPFYESRNTARIPDYHRLDFSWNIYNATMQKRRWEGSWAFTVYNLYGRRNAYSVFYRAETNTTQSYKLTIFGAPIITLAYNFKFM